MAIPTLCLTFDRHPETATNAFAIMQPLGLVGTYFVAPSTIGQADGPTLDRCLVWKMMGDEIGVYSHANMVTMLQDKYRVATNNYLAALKRAMADRGLLVSTLAPAQRAWSPALANLAEGHFSRVRVADQLRSDVGAWQDLPIANPLNVRRGGSYSLSNGDTVQSLSAQVDDLIAKGGMWSPVIHRVANDGLQPNYTINTTRFAGFCQKIATEVQAGRLRCCNYRDA